MEKYINNSLEAGIIYRLAFFVEMKETTLKHFHWHYQGHNEITVKNCLIICLQPPGKGHCRHKARPLQVRKRRTQGRRLWNMPTGNYEYLVMPSVLTNPALLFDMYNKHVFVYLDDILNCS